MQRDLLVTLWLLLDEIRDNDPKNAAVPSPAVPASSEPRTRSRHSGDHHDS